MNTRDAVTDDELDGLAHLVKPLDWKDYEYQSVSKPVLGLEYIVLRNWAKDGEWWCATANTGFHNAREDAKKAADVDNARRILSALNLDALRSPPADVGWQPIDTAPKDDLIDIWLSDGLRWCDCYHDRITDTWRTSRPSGRLVSVQSQFVTHWMRRPESPRALAETTKGDDPSTET